MAENSQNIDEERLARRNEAEAVVKSAKWWSFGVGVVPIPLLDIAALTALQLNMTSRLSRIYGTKFSSNAGKAFIASLVGSVVPTRLALGGVGSLIKTIPFVGTLAGAVTMPIFGAATTAALGRVFIKHFETGGTFLDLDPDSVSDHFRREYESEMDELSPQSGKGSARKPATATAGD